MKFIRLILVLLLCYPVVSCAKGITGLIEFPTLVVIKSFPFFSAIVRDSFVVDISLPRTYFADTTKRYPLLIMTDGNWRRPQHEKIHALSDTAGVKELLIVGISYPDSYNVSTIRIRDFLRQPEKFLDFILCELLPYVESNYRVTDERALWGSSFGGYFVLYALFRYNDKTQKVFRHYIVASPAALETTLCNGVSKNLFDFEEQLAQETDSLPVNLYMTVGGNEDRVRFYDPFVRLVSQLEQRQYKNFHFLFFIDPGKDHFTVWEPTLYKGICLFFHL